MTTRPTWRMKCLLVALFMSVASPAFAQEAAAYTLVTPDDVIPRSVSPGVVNRSLRKPQAVPRCVANSNPIKIQPVAFPVPAMDRNSFSQRTMPSVHRVSANRGASVSVGYTYRQRNTWQAVWQPSESRFQAPVEWQQTTIRQTQHRAEGSATGRPIRQSGNDRHTLFGKFP